MGNTASARQPATIVRLAPGDEQIGLAAAALFDAPPSPGLDDTVRSERGPHHLLVALDEDEATIRFVSPQSPRIVQLARTRQSHSSR